MTLDFSTCDKMFAKNHTILVYGGPLWANGVYNMAAVLKQYLDMRDQSSNEAHSVFAVFVEQLNNMLMHSEEKEMVSQPDGSTLELPKGSFILGIHNGSYFIQTANAVAKDNAPALKDRIDYLNGLEKEALMNNYKERVKSKKSSSETKGAGLGLLEVAWRCTSKIAYEFTPGEDNMLNFTMRVTI